MARRRKLDIGLASSVLSQVLGISHPVAKTALTIAQHQHVTRAGHYSKLGNPLTNYKKQVVRIPKVSQRRFSPISETTGKTFSRTSKAMPYRRSYRRKVYRPRKRYGMKRRRLTAIPTSLPSQKVIRLKLVHSIDGLGSGSGALIRWPIKANSLNDPTGVLSAQLPYLVDQYAPMYNKYIVLGSKISIRVFRTSGTGPMIAGLHLANDTTSLADHDFYKEAPLTRTVTLTDDKPNKVISMNYSGKRFWKVPSIKSDSEQEADFSTTPGDPTDIAYWHFFLQDLAKTHANTVEAQFTIEYIVLLTDVIHPARSAL